MGSYKWGYGSPHMGYNYSYPTYSPTCSYPPHPKPYTTPIEPLKEPYSPTYSYP